MKRKFRRTETGLPTPPPKEDRELTPLAPRAKGLTRLAFDSLPALAGEPTADATKPGLPMG